MADPEVTPQGPPAAAAPAAAPGPASAAGLVAGRDPAAVAPRRRRRWPLVSLVAVVAVAGLAAGLVAWAPWTPPPVLRPAGLVAGAATATSISFRWSPPATGPLPDRYLILSAGTAARAVAGTVTSYRQAGLTPASTYHYHVVAVRGGTRSAPSAPLAVRTLTPPISQARLQGPFDIQLRYLRPRHGGVNGTLAGGFIPACAAGACDVVLQVTEPRYSYTFTMKLARAGARYHGHALLRYTRCRVAGNSIPDPTTLTIRIHVTAAAGEGQAWLATSWAGTMVGTYHYASGAAFYCPATTYTVALAGTPA